MAKLTQDQINFLRDNKIPLSKVYDASGLSNPDWKAAMKDLGMWVAFGTSPCEAAGHTLRLRSGHCLQCRPEGLSYQKRHETDGQVYVAASLSSRLVKIGTAIDSDSRIANLNSYCYGGASDWIKHLVIHCESAGKVETTAHTTLSNFAESRTYSKNGKTIESRELFSCGVKEAVSAVNSALNTIKPKYRVLFGGGHSAEIKA